jgi:hypothetical protein
MGRPLNKRLFGANASNNIKVQFHNGTDSVKGYIVKQLGTKKFLCKDVDGNTAICRLKLKDSADLAAGEMSITVKYDDDTVRHVYKIAAHRISVNPVTNSNTTVGMDTAGWTFATSTTDQKWQIEEAGTDSSMTASVDYEGDDFNSYLDYPVPASGNYRTAATALTGITYADIGSVTTATAGITTVTDSVDGLIRTKYLGNFTASAMNVASTPYTSFNWFSTATFIKSIADEDISWGDQSDGDALGENHFSIEWKGYIKVPTTKKYNFYLESDDTTAVWIGTNALSGMSSSNFLLTSSNKSLPSNASSSRSVNTLSMDSTKWYPIRIWYSEFTGGCKFQLYAIDEDGNKYNGQDLQWAYNGTTSGYNP